MTMSKKALLLFSLFGLLILPAIAISGTAASGTALAALPAQAPTSQPQQPNRPANVQRDVTYCTAGGVDLKMDIYAPRQGATLPSPALLYVHGGGWTQGSKGDGEGSLDIDGM